MSIANLLHLYLHEAISFGRTTDSLVEEEDWIEERTGQLMEDLARE